LKNKSTRNLTQEKKYLRYMSSWSNSCAPFSK